MYIYVYIYIKMIPSSGAGFDAQAQRREVSQKESSLRTNTRGDRQIKIIGVNYTRIIVYE